MAHIMFLFFSVEANHSLVPRAPSAWLQVHTVADEGTNESEGCQSEGTVCLKKWDTCQLLNLFFNSGDTAQDICIGN